MILLLLLCSCAASHTWQISHLQTGSPDFDSSRIVCPSSNPVSGIDLELTRTDGQIFAHLHVHTETTLPYDENPKEALVRLSTPDHTFSGIAYRHEGGQRLLLPDALKDPLVQALTQGKDVTIELIGYRSLISAQGFAEAYASLQKTPFRNPLQPPVPL